MNTNNSHFVKCDCSSHILECERYCDSDKEQGFNFAVWNYGHDGNERKKWKERFRWCWRILNTGNPWADSIIATNKDARGLANFILKNLPPEETNEINTNK